MTFRLPQKPIKPKTGRCGHRFTPTKSFQPYCPTCEMKFKTGKAEVEDLNSLPLPTLKAMARAVFQAWIRKRDTGKPCISCGKDFKKGDVIHASHAYKAELFTGLIFEETGCHASCDWCNTAMDGNTKEYLKRLPARIGEVAWAELQLLAVLPMIRSHKFSRAEYIEIIEKYSPAN